MENVKTYDADSYKPVQSDEVYIYQDEGRIFYRKGQLTDAVARLELARQEKDRLVFELTTVAGKTAALRVLPLQGGMFRITLVSAAASDPQAWALVQETSVMLETLPGAAVWHLDQGTPGTYRLVTQDHVLILGKDPFFMRLETRAGTKLFELETENVAGDFISPALGFIHSSDAPDQAGQPFMSWHMDNHESLFGLGEKFNKVEKRQTRATIWAADTCGTNSCDLSYKSLPLLYSTAGYGLMLHSSFRSKWEIGSFNYNAASCCTEEPHLDCFLFAGKTLKDLVAGYARLTGMPKLLPRWAMGIWMSRCAYHSRQQADQVIQTMAEMKMPCDVIHLDPPWMQTHYYFDLGVDACDFEWSKDRFQDPQGMFAAWKKAGIRTCLWINPYLPEGKPIYEHASKAGYLVKDRSGGNARLEGGQRVGIIDFTNPQAREWWKGQLRTLIRLGASVLKPDYGDRVPSGGVFHNGKTGSEMHNLFLFLYTETAYQAVEEELGPAHALTWRRSGYLGSQRYPGTWAGDTQVSWNGLANCLKGGLNASFSAEAWWASDIGGFCGPKPEPELYVRWAQFGLLSPLARFHGTSPREPWEYGEEACRIVLEYARLRYTLIPYLESAGRWANASGIPVMRHLRLEFPQEVLASHVDDQFLLGPSLMVCPVVNPGQLARQVYFPAGRWHDWWDSSRFVDGPCVREVPAPLDRLPLFVRGGAAIPRYLHDPMNLQGDYPQELGLDVYLPGPQDVLLPECLYLGDDGATMLLAREGRKVLHVSARSFGLKLRLIGPETDRVLSWPASGMSEIDLESLQAGHNLAGGEK